MKNIFAAILLLFCLAETHAQKWFTPQAKWYRGLGNALEISKEKDTLIDNKLCVKLAARYKDLDSKQWIPYPKHNMLMYDDTLANIQYLFVKGQFYVLYDFNKSIGDTIFIPGIDAMGYQGEMDSGAWSVVDSVGIDTIMGIAYKTMHYKEILKADEDVIWPHYDWRFSGKIIETIGNLSNFMPVFQKTTVPSYDEPLRCFENEYINLKLTDYPCDTSMGWVGVKEILDEKTVTIYPNPFNEYINIDLSKTSAQVSEIVLMNSIGEVVLSNFSTSFNTVHHINTSTLKAGLYLCKIKAGDMELNYKIIKP
jgi:hypothetical protein